MESIEFETFRDDLERIDVAELACFYAQQKHRTTSDLRKLRRMLQSSFCVVTARKNGHLIGIARGTTDGINGQLVECKLDPCFQGPGAVTHTDGRIEHDKEGIAVEMAKRVLDALRDYGVESIHVLAYGTEVDFCEELGFKRIGGMVALQREFAVDAPVLAAPAV